MYDTRFWQIQLLGICLESDGKTADETEDDCDHSLDEIRMISSQVQ